MALFADVGIATGAFVVERNDWKTSVTKAAEGGYRFLELTAMTLERLDRLFPFLEEWPALLEPFDRVSVHAPASEARGSTAAVVEALERLDPAFDIVLHPDVYVDEPSVLRLGSRAVFENMDCQKDFGRTIADLDGVFSTFPHAGFCLDVAHVRTNDPSIGLAYELIGSFSNRLRQLHLSGIEEDGNHRPTTTDDLMLYEPVLASCKHVPWLLETELADEPG